MSQPRRVAVADDQRPTRQGLHALLDLLPGVLWVGEAVNGRDAVALVAEQRPDVVLMDAQMPEMDGLEATRRIKSQSPEVRVIMLTLHGDYRAEALAAGADVFLVKGGPPEGLRNAICAA
jgi:DNA-binding NarL/FixJ family response regulator